MKRVNEFAMQPLESQAESTCSTGQKNYVSAWQRAAQFNHPFRETSSITRVSTSESRANNLSDDDTNL